MSQSVSRSLLGALVVGVVAAAMAVPASAGTVRRPKVATAVLPPPPVVVVTPVTAALPPVICDPSVACNQSGNGSVSRC